MGMFSTQRQLEREENSRAYRRTLPKNHPDYLPPPPHVYPKKHALHQDNRRGQEDMKLPKHVILEIQHNDNKVCHRTVAQELDIDGIAVPQFRTCADKQECIDKDEIWTMRWYPITPVGFHFIGAPTFEKLLEWATEYEALKCG